MGAPATPPGWYPEPSGGLGQRYFDGNHWTDQVARGAQAAQPSQRRTTKALWIFVGLAIASPVVALVSFVLMQLAFGAAGEGSAALAFEIMGFVLFIVWLASIVSLIVGIVGTIVQLTRH